MGEDKDTLLISDRSVHTELEVTNNQILAMAGDYLFILTHQLDLICNISLSGAPDTYNSGYGIWDSSRNVWWYGLVARPWVGFGFGFIGGVDLTNFVILDKRFSCFGYSCSVLYRNLVLNSKKDSIAFLSTLNGRNYTLDTVSLSSMKKVNSVATPLHTYAIPALDIDRGLVYLGNNAVLEEPVVYQYDINSLSLLSTIENLTNMEILMTTFNRKLDQLYVGSSDYHNSVIQVFDVSGKSATLINQISIPAMTVDTGSINYATQQVYFGASEPGVVLVFTFYELEFQ